jgi:hypothetical protein
MHNTTAAAAAAATLQLFIAAHCTAAAAAATVLCCMLLQHTSSLQRWHLPVLLLQCLLQGLLLLPQLLQCCTGAAAELRLTRLQLLQSLGRNLHTTDTQNPTAQ